MTLDALVAGYAAEQPYEVAVGSCHRGSTSDLTWRELDDRSVEVVRHLAEASTGGSPVCVHVAVGDDPLGDLIFLVGALRSPYALLVTPSRQPPSLQQSFEEDVRRQGFELLSASEIRAEPPGARVRPGTGQAADTALTLLPTGGSTGRPRLVADHGIRASVDRPPALRPFLATGWQAGQRQFVCSPLHHAAGLSSFVEGLACGNTTYVPTQFDPVGFVDVVEDRQVEWVQATPFHLSSLLPHLPRVAAMARPPVLLHTSEHCPARVKRAFHEALGATRVYEMYAASEGLGVTIARGDEWEDRPGTVGRGFLTSVRILDEQDRPLPAGEEGEVFLRAGLRRERAYLGTTSGRLRTTPDGYSTLGDVGHVDEDGYLYLRPRQVRTVSVGGVTVSPADVEAEIAEHPAVVDVGVGGVVDGDLGQRVAAVVCTADTGLDERTLLRWSRGRMSPAWVPQRITFVRVVPRRENGKLDREALQLILEQGTDDGRTASGNVAAR